MIESHDISNKDFLQAIFGDQWKLVHAASFKQDPTDPQTPRSVWAGKYFIQYFAATPNPFIETYDYNNYFTISTFTPPEDQPRSTRRKQLFKSCHLVVIDDVIAKVPVERLKKMGFPAPTYTLETSPGNFQWGFKFSAAVTSREQVEHLVNSWVARGIAIGGQDPGMKGVTRYVRLPVGCNTKAIYGEPFRHRLEVWEPWIEYSIEELAEMTDVDLSLAPKPNTVVATQIVAEEDDETLQALYEAGLVQRKLKPGWYEIICPWVEGHSQRAKTGAAYVQKDGFCCHHGSCEGRHGAHLRHWLQEKGFLKTLTPAEMFAGVIPNGKSEPAPLPVQEVERIGPDLYIYELGKFYNTRTGVFKSAEEMNRENPQGDKEPGYVTKFFESWKHEGYNYFDGLTYLPGTQRVHISEDGTRFNTWIGGSRLPVNRPATLWLELLERLFPDPQERQHLIRWLAFTVRHQSVKINHCLLIVGLNQGQGKDTLIEPVIEALGRHNTGMVFPREFNGTYNDFIKDKKLIVVQEIKDYSKNNDLENYLKPLLAAPPEMLAINEKYVPRYHLPNIANYILFSNDLSAVRVSMSDRRYYCVKSEAEALGPAKASELWDWYSNEQGFEAVYNYLMNVDLSAFNPKAPPPVTEFKEKLQKHSLSNRLLILQDLLEGGDPSWEYFEMNRLMQHFHIHHPKEPISVKGLSLDLEKLDFTNKRTTKKGISRSVWHRKKSVDISTREMLRIIDGGKNTPDSVKD